MFGAILVTFLASFLSSVTDAWVLYFGLMFIGVVMFAPQGLFGILHQQSSAIRDGHWRGSTLARIYLLLTMLLSVFGLVCVVELSYHYFRSWDPSAPFDLMGFTVNATTAMPWIASFAILVIGIALLTAHARPMLRRRTGANPDQGEH